MLKGNVKMEDQITLRRELEAVMNKMYSNWKGFSSTKLDEEC